ncbi:DNA (cytosine-5-)-methyltransferase [Mycoplasmopsis agassizii]|uniref:DNA (cytosine-5-)-methyltransferase n=1 Tax=Mycoplasmopsis agassizii TaxID=33922 RepID=UPI0035281DB3
MNKLKVIDLFCGVGGFSYGFEMTNLYEVVLGVDLWETALNTFKKNHSSTNLLLNDITKVELSYWEQYKNKIDVIIAGPPCQGFSMSGKREINDVRNTLFEQVVKVAEVIEPKYIVIENVVGLLSMKNDQGEDIKELIQKGFENIGYRVNYKVLNAADYGVPQARKRVIFLISKNYPLDFPEAIYDKENYITVGDALGNVDPDGDTYFCPSTEYQKLMEGNSKITNHSRRNSNELVTKRMSYIPQGGNWQNIPVELGTGGGTHSNAYKRLDPNKPSITIKHAAKAMIIHPLKNRILTVREVARLQSFNDNFEFTGSNSDQHQQLANAVPPLLGKAIAEQIYKNISFEKETQLKFIDLFSGLGGFRLAFEKNNCKCVFSSEIDKYAIETYKANFNETPKGDITKIDSSDIPNHDILCAGFPCQSFSIAGKRLGFNDTRGTLFFEIARILKDKKPSAFILENVKGIVNHDGGKTLDTILNIINDLGYSYQYKVLNSKDFGIPQSRERWYCIGIKNGLNVTADDFVFPTKSESKINLNQIIKSNNDPKYQITKTAKKNIDFFVNKKNIEVKNNSLAYEIRPSRCQFKLDGIAPTLTAKMGTGGNNIPVVIKQNRKLTENECLQIMGYPDGYKIKEGYQSYKQIGNSVVVPVITKLAEELVRILKIKTKSTKKDNKINQTLLFS